MGAGVRTCVVRPRLGRVLIRVSCSRTEPRAHNGPKPRADRRTDAEPEPRPDLWTDAEPE